MTTRLPTIVWQPKSSCRIMYTVLPVYSSSGMCIQLLSRHVIFTALHCMQRSLSDRKAVCSSVCLSVKTKESSADILTPVSYTHLTLPTIYSV